jgi:N-methylhydantoinase B
VAKDIISIETVKNAFDSTANEMFWTTIRTSKSPIFYETLDFTTVLTNGQYDTIATAIGVPLWAAVGKFVAASSIEGIRKMGEEVLPNDVIISNDPYETGTHLNDIGLAMPIFYKDEIFAVAVAKGHCYDVGGMTPGSWGPGSTDIYQEGICVPPTKYYDQGKPNKALMRLLMANSRTADYIHGDLEALAASLRLADRRMRELVEKYGLETVKDAMTGLLQEGEERARAGLKELPKGEFYVEDYLDESYVSPDPLKLTAKIKITDEAFTVDLSDNPKALPAPLNNPYPGTFAAVSVVFMAVTNPHTPFNYGLLRPLNVIAPLGTIFNPQRPSPVSVYWETMAYAADLVWKALAPHMPDKLSAGHFLTVASESISGTDPRTKEYFVLCEPNPGGWGAGIDQDGESALVAYADGETYANPVEVLEIRFPVLVERFELNVGGGVGHGKYRGGFGMVKDYQILSDDTVLTTDINRSKFPPWGVDGGQNGTLNYLAVIRDGKEIMRVSRLMNYKLKKGDVVSIRTAGGGGWGHPYGRDPRLVADDVRKALVTIDQAREIYGVLVKPETLEVDLEATRRLRETKVKNAS